MPSVLSLVGLALQVATASPGSSAHAFRDSAARDLLTRGREARQRLDSSIVSYEATAHRRLTAGATAGRLVRDRILLRSENVTLVRWHRDVGAHVEVKAARTVHPGASEDKANRSMLDNVPELTVLPYYPGQETFWIESGLELDEDQLLHPLAPDAELHYVYESGDSSRIRLQDGAEVRLRELKVRPRTIRWNAIVGSLWFDADRGALVRAAYRFAEPMEVWDRIAEDSANQEQVPRGVSRLARPLRAHVTAMVVEYGLHEGRFWLPRLQTVDGFLEAVFLRAPFSIENRFRFTAVNAPPLDSLPPIPVQPPASSSSIGTAEPPLNPCDSGSTFTIRRRRTKGRVPMSVTTPCDHRVLADSPELSGSIYSPGEDPFDLSGRDRLLAEALGLAMQPEWNPRPARFDHGLSLVRFNRVEGLSLGARVTRQLGAGLVADGALRFGFADREPNVELGLARTNIDRTVRIAAFNELVSANDWGNPLTFVSSLSALLFGRDDGFYHRATGVEITGTRERGAGMTWRIFAERQRPAIAENSFSIARLLRGIEFPPNIAAARGTWAGAAVRAAHTIGLDPRGWRLFTDVRLEGAGGRTAYGRAAADLTVSRALGPATSTVPLAALTLSSGQGAGDVPVQRYWFLGGVHTVRGQPAGTAAGDAYWLARAELAQEALRIGRLALFADAGWAGPRAAFADSAFRVRDHRSDPRALSGAGIGYSILDGLIRLDVARGLHPYTAWRLDLYLEARF